MRKSVTYFNFGCLLTMLAVIIQVIIKIILKTFSCEESYWITLILPVVLAIIFGFIWYKQERTLLKVEQYLIAITPLILFLGSSLVLMFKDYFPLNAFNIWAAVFILVYVLMRIAIYSLAKKLTEIDFINRLQLKAFLYLVGCNLVIWHFAFWLFLY